MTTPNPDFQLHFVEVALKGDEPDRQAHTGGLVRRDSEDQDLPYMLELTGPQGRVQVFLSAQLADYLRTTFETPLEGGRTNMNVTLLPSRWPIEA